MSNWYQIKAEEDREQGERVKSCMVVNFDESQSTLNQCEILPHGTRFHFPITTPIYGAVSASNPRGLSKQVVQQGHNDRSIVK